VLAGLKRVPIANGQRYGFHTLQTTEQAPQRRYSTNERDRIRIACEAQTFSTDSWTKQAMWRGTSSKTVSGQSSENADNLTTP
jgi:hypothetical protein